MAFHAAEFPYFDRGARPKLAAFATMTQYDSKVEVPAAFPPQSLKMILGEVLARHGIPQLRTAETEKYAHVTYFFNGGNETPCEGEERILVPSNRNVATYDLAPEMSALPVTDGVVAALERPGGGPPFILVNYANPDMVGHTGMLKPAVSAIETIDACIGRVVAAAEKAGAAVFITADHGNCETMIDPITGQPHTAHTMNPVPFLAIGKDLAGRKFRAHGRLCDVAPTILEYMGLPQPPEMDAISLFERSSG
jgi:2,3-bisphosphoglycerate-independent phosphoglycerate mutase